MRLLTKKELSIALGLGTFLGLVVALILTILMMPTDTPPVASMLTAFHTEAPSSLSFYATSVEDTSFPDIINIPMEISISHPTNDTSHYHLTNVRVSFYTGLACENGGYTEKNALGGSLKVGSLAAPSDIPFGTTFIIKNLPPDIPTDTFTVDDRGGAIKRLNHNTIKVDVYVKRREGESDALYFTRANNLGIRYTKALYKLPPRVQK